MEIKMNYLKNEENIFDVCTVWSTHKDYCALYFGSNSSFIENIEEKIVEITFACADMLLKILINLFCLQ